MDLATQPQADIFATTGVAPTPGTDLAALLRAQLNRFASWRAGGSRFFSDPLPRIGPVDATVSARAGRVLIARLLVQKQTGIESDPAAAKLAGEIAADLTGNVVRANLPMVLGTVTGFADAHGLPKVLLPGQINWFSTPLLLSAAAVVVASTGLLLFSRRNRMMTP